MQFEISKIDDMAWSHTGSVARLSASLAGRLCHATVQHPVGALSEDTTLIDDLFWGVFKFSVNVTFNPEMYGLLNTCTRCLWLS
jgi:hypothetical protein